MCALGLWGSLSLKPQLIGPNSLHCLKGNYYDALVLCYQVGARWDVSQIDKIIGALCVSYRSAPALHIVMYELRPQKVDYPWPTTLWVPEDVSLTDNERVCFWQSLVSAIIIKHFKNANDHNMRHIIYGYYHWLHALKSSEKNLAQLRPKLSLKWHSFSWLEK